MTWEVYTRRELIYLKFTLVDNMTPVIIKTTTGETPVVWYPSGARGDFLISILYGDILEYSFATAEIYKPYGKSGLLPKAIKMHDWEWTWPVKLTDLDNTDTIMIVPSTLEEIKMCATLISSKHNGNVKGCMLHTANWVMDHSDYFTHKNVTAITLGDVFNIDFLKDLFFSKRNRHMSDQELCRVQHNIEINLQILRNHDCCYLEL